MDAALKSVAADKDHRWETDDEVAPTTPLGDACSSVRGMISSKVQSSGTSSHMLCTRVQLWMAEPFCNRPTSAATFEFLTEGCSTLNARCCRVSRAKLFLHLLQWQRRLMWQRPSVSSELEPFCQVESVLPISSIMAYVFLRTANLMFLICRLSFDLLNATCHSRIFIRESSQFG